MKTSHNLKREDFPTMESFCDAVKDWHAAHPQPEIPVVTDWDRKIDRRRMRAAVISVCPGDGVRGDEDKLYDYDSYSDWNRYQGGE